MELRLTDPSLTLHTIHTYLRHDLQLSQMEGDTIKFICADWSPFFKQPRNEIEMKDRHLEVEI